MKYLKKIIFYLMIVLTFTLSFSKEENRITIFEKDNEPAKLKIGVTKLKTQELEMDFDMEKKIIYCELPDEIGENDTIYVSETLDEIPSVSTTNGRRTINNIKKYLTKEVKANSKFNYRIETIKNEESGEEKKYLVIHCKEQATGVYLYVVEKDTYKMKKLYKGKFLKLLSSPRATETTFGNIIFSGEHEIPEGEEATITFNGREMLLNGSTTQGYGKVEQLYGNGFPTKYNYGDMTDGFHRANRYKLIVDGQYIFYNTDGVKQGSKEFDWDNPKIEETVKLKNKNTGEEIGTLIISQNTNNEYMQFKIITNDKFAEVDTEIGFEYGHGGDEGLRYEAFYLDKFRLIINKKQGEGIPFLTKGQVLIDKEHKLYDKKDHILTAKDGKVVLDGAEFDYLKSDGKFPKRVDFENIDFGTVIGSRSVDIEMVYGYLTEDDKTVSVTKTSNVLNRDGTFSTLEFDAKGRESVAIGKVEVISNVNSEYIQFKLKDWEFIGDPISLKFKIKYKAEGKVLKEDTLTLDINPQDERIPKNTSGTLLIVNPENLTGNNLLFNDGKLSSAINYQERDETPFTVQGNAILSGEFPKLFKSNDKEENSEWLVNWGDTTKNRIVVIDDSGKEHEMGGLDDSGNIDFDEKQGTFEQKDAKWLDLKTKNGRKVGEIYFTMDRFGLNNEKIVIGFREDDKPILGDNEIVLGEDEFVETEFTFEYRAYIGGDKYETKKRDKLEIIIQPSLEFGADTKIDVVNPIVYYDYKDRSYRNRRTHLVDNKATTLSKDNSSFRKNTTMEGNQWIKAEKIPQYDWKKLGRHRIGIKSGDNEVLKYTDEKGKTQSSTFVKLNEGNEIMFSYDGGRPEINFGVSKYDFEGTKGVVRITHYESGSSSIDTITDYNITLPKFDGKPYVDPLYDIKVDRDYIKYHQFDNEIGQNEITIDYGEVGFKDLDTRITHQSGGEGIEIRAYEDVYLQSEEFPEYKIQGARLFFDTKIIGGKKDTTGFKGKNEKSTSKILRLTIPSQEQIIPKGRFKILRADIKEEKSPLEVGVIVNGDQDKYFTEITDLYLDTTDSRYASTKIVFENPELSLEKNQQWIQLDKNGGVLKGDPTSSIWGHVEGNLIDVPVDYDKYPDLKDKDLKLQVFIRDNGKVIVENLANIKGDWVRIKDIYSDNFDNSQNSGFDFILRKYNQGDKYIGFSLTNGYDEDNRPEDFEFFIRYLVKGENGEKDKFLFDQRYEVTFAEKTKYNGDTTLILKNPITVWNEKSSSKLVLVDGTPEQQLELDNREDNYYTFDSIIWWEIINPVKYGQQIEEFEMQYDRYEIKYLGNNKEVKDYFSLNVNKDADRRLRINITKDFLDAIDYDPLKDFKGTFEIKLIPNPAAGTGIMWKNEIYRLTIKIDKFDPKYFGKIFPANTIQSRGEAYEEENIVGTGEEKLYFNSAQLENGKIYRYIDLGTSYRDYTRYLGLREYTGDLQISAIEGSEIIAYPTKGVNNKSVKGTIVFGTNYSEVTYVKVYNKIDSQNCPDIIPIYFRVEEEEYNKLQADTMYELYSNGEKNIITIGNEKVSEQLKLDRPLNFYTKASGFEIPEVILNFGDIELGAENKDKEIKKYASVDNIIVTSEHTDRYTLTINPNVKIYRQVGSNIDEGHSLDVTNLNVKEMLEKPQISDKKIRDTDQNTKYFILSGELTVPIINSEKIPNYLGQYEGKTYFDIILNAPEE